MNSDLSWLADLGTAGIVLIVIVIMQRWFTTTIKTLARSVDKNSVSVVTLGQSIVSLVSILSSKKCVTEDLDGMAAELIKRLEEKQKDIADQRNGDE